MTALTRIGHHAAGLGLLTALTCALPGAASAADRGADGRFDKRTSSHFVLYQDVDIDRSSGFRGSRRFEQQVLDVLESAHQQLDRHLGLRPERPITVVVYDPAVFDREFSGLFRFPAAGFYGGRVHVRGGTAITDRLVAVLHHELVHAAYDAEAPSLILPAWLNEGTAEWLEARALGRRGLSHRQWGWLVEVAAAGRLFGLGDLSTRSFSHLGPDGARLAYIQSLAFVDHLTRVYGDRSLREFVREIVRTGDVDRSARRTFRADLARLEGEFVAELLASGR